MKKLALPIVIVGHIDHGKSTLIGRLLYETGALKEGWDDYIQRSSSYIDLDIEYAFALDALKEERDGLMTIDTTHAYFSSMKRRYAIVDVPGHREFLKNMITGTSYAEAAVLVVDASEGIQEQTKRHAYILNLVGIRNIIIAVNKMDIAGYDKQIFGIVCKDIIAYLNNLNLKPVYSVPVSAKFGDNIITRSDLMSWYEGPSLIEALDALEIKTVSQKPFRYPVQDIYIINGETIIVGRVESGEAVKDMDVFLLPAAKKCRIAKIIKYMSEPLKQAGVGEAAGLVLDNGYSICRGDIIAGDKNAVITNELHARVFWFDGFCRQNDRITIKHTTQSVEASIRILNKLDPAVIDELILSPEQIEIGEVAEVKIKTKKTIVIDPFSVITEMGRFIIEKDGIPVGGGIVI